MQEIEITPAFCATRAHDCQAKANACEAAGNLLAAHDWQESVYVWLRFRRDICPDLG